MRNWKLCYYWLHQRVTWEIVTPWRPCNVDRGEAEVDIGFLGVTISHVTLSCSQYLLYYTECYLIIRYMHRLHYVWFQNNPGQVNVWVCLLYSLNSNAHTTPVRIYGELYTHKFCAVYIFWISPVAKFHHVIGHGFTIQRVILIVIKCLSANQIQLFYMKV